MNLRNTLRLPAPAKLNLFLHVTGRRDDGYHTLESLLVPIDHGDHITLSERSDSAVVRERGAVEIAAHLGEVLWAKGERDRAQEIWQSQLKETPDNPVLLDTVRRLAR